MVGDGKHGAKVVHSPARNNEKGLKFESDSLVCLVGEGRADGSEYLLAQELHFRIV